MRITPPAGAHVALCTIGVHRNPRYWPNQPSKISNRPDDLDDFIPERWLVRVSANGTQQIENSADSDDYDDIEGLVKRIVMAKFSVMSKVHIFLSLQGHTLASGEN